MQVYDIKYGEWRVYFNLHNTDYTTKNFTCFYKDGAGRRHLFDL